jgi:regulator of sigma E protease
MSIFVEIIIFLVVLIVLIVVHELGHFIVAKLSGMRVDEFGFGYPPRALLMGKIGETEYTLNWLPFGGFVRIFGEDEASAEVSNGDSERAFSRKPKVLQMLTLIAGIVMNVLLAWILLTVVLIVGSPQELSETQVATAKNVSVAFSTITSNSPADKAGFMPGDEIKSAEVVSKSMGISYNGENPLGYSTLIGGDTVGDPIHFVVDRNGKTLTLIATPVTKVIPGSPSRPGIGVEIVIIGTVKTPIAKAPIQAAQLTWTLTKETAVGLWQFFKGVVTFSANLSEVSGPVGIAGAIGQAATNGISALLTLTALISINLALINLLPIPALDGGRLLFVIIEAAIGRPLNPKIAERVNMVGFALLVLLMIVITGHDIFKLFK